jgi:hypothetical protein
VRRELRELLESQIFKQAPKLGSLLQYVSNKVLMEEGERVTEYTIAMDVFGKTASFKESKDSNVRVEVHRLRKRLAHFYENEGAGRPIRIVIPPGRYTPDFLVTEPTPEEPQQQQQQPVEAIAEPVAILQPPPVAEPEPRTHRENRFLPYAVVAAGLVLTVAAVFWGMHRSLRPRQTTSGTLIPPQSRAEPASLPNEMASGGAPVPLRVMSGYSGPPHTDGSGAVWESDRYFQGGRPSDPTDGRIARTNDPLLFQHSRIGDFSYNIPLKPGVYELHLFFVESEYGPENGHGENDRTFFLHINDQRLMPSVDIESEAMGPNIADERVFKDVHPAADGKLHVLFESATGVPILNALEVLPGIPHKQLPIRLVVQPFPFIDHIGQVWRPDNYYLNGQTCPRNLAVARTPDPGMFGTERYGHFTYAIPVDVHGRYTVSLHFAEFYFGPESPGHGGVGGRVFNVMCDGVLLLDHLDIFKEVGSGHALTKTFYHLKPTAQGKLNLTFEPVTNYALIFGIEVLDESE